MKNTVMGHTPGPWTYRAADRIEGSPQTFQAIVYGADNNHYVADVFGVSRTGDVVPWDANARLIAAAPELLEAAKVINARLASSPVIWAVEIAQMRAAIAKAEGA